MSDLSGYRQQVADLGKKAVQAENDKNYEEAYHHYHSALKIFMHLIKCKSIFNLTVDRWNKCEPQDSLQREDDLVFG